MKKAGFHRLFSYHYSTLTHFTASAMIIWEQVIFEFPFTFSIPVFITGCKSVPRLNRIFQINHLNIKY